MPQAPDPASASEARSSLSEFSSILLHAPAPLIDDLYALVTSGVLHSTEGLALLSHESFSPPVSSSILATFDSGSDVHVLTVEAAQTLFASLSPSELRIVGVSGSPTRADLKGHLVVMAESPDGSQHHIDLGLAHAMRACPLNLLSVSLLLQVGAIVHFEPGNCFFQPHAGAAKIPFQQRDGMFQLEVHRGDPVQAPSAPNSDAVRSLYLDPDSSLPPHPLDEDLSRRAVSNGSAAADAALDSTESEHQRKGPLTPTAIAAEHVRNLLREGVVLRPLRLLPVGRIAPLSPDDQAFLRHARLNNYPLAYLSPCPKKGDSARRYLKYMHASTLAEASALGATKADIDWDFERGFISFPRHEPDLPGHVHCAFELAHRHGVVHALLESRRGVPRSFETDIGLARVYNTSSRVSFHQQLETVFEPEVIVDQLASREKLLRFSEHQFAKVLNSSAIDIDFSLSPEPTKYADILPDRCVEAEHWRGAMDDEMRSMERFGVYKRVPKSAARGRQILGCRWVYKRKVNKFGQVCRYRARLVAQGFLQRAFDSYQPDETYSPVVHKDTLRMFLSLCAAEETSRCIVPSCNPISRSLSSCVRLRVIPPRRRMARKKSLNSPEPSTV